MAMNDPNQMPPAPMGVRPPNPYQQSIAPTAPTPAAMPAPPEVRIIVIKAPPEHKKSEAKDEKAKDEKRMPEHKTEHKPEHRAESEHEYRTESDHKSEHKSESRRERDSKIGKNLAIEGRKERGRAG